MSVKVLASKTYMLHDIQKIQSEFLKSKYLKKKKKKKKKNSADIRFKFCQKCGLQNARVSKYVHLS